jgi:hypothetical protein
VLGDELEEVFEVVLPPGGEESGPVDLSFNFGLVTVTATEARVACAGEEGDILAPTTCLSEVHELSVVANGEEIIRAETLRATSNSFRTPEAGFQSTSFGTTISGLCIVTQEDTPCVDVPAGQTVEIENGLITGTIGVQVEETRDSHEGIAGSGLTVTLLQADLQIGNFGSVVIDAVVADSFAGEPTDGEPFEADLFEGWNPVDYEGPAIEQEELDAALGAIITPSSAWYEVARYEGGVWLTHFADPPLPAFNTLPEIVPGKLYWFFATAEAHLDTSPIE